MGLSSPNVSRRTQKRFTSFRWFALQIDTSERNKRTNVGRFREARFRLEGETKSPGVRR